MKITNNQKLVFIGDSVTDVDRARPVAEGLFDPLGRGYPHLVSGLLNAVYPELNIRIVNMGTSGNTSSDLVDRWQTDVFDLKPDWLSIMIGINDIWRQFDLPAFPEKQVLPKQYEKNVTWMVSKTLPKLSGGLVLMSPYFFETNMNDAMRARVEEYRNICKKIAKKYPKVIFADTQAYIEKMLKYHHPAYYTWDRVHPNVYGHTAVARAFLNAVDFDFNH